MKVIRSSIDCDCSEDAILCACAEFQGIYKTDLFFVVHVPRYIFGFNMIQNPGDSPIFFIAGRGFQNRFSWDITAYHRQTGEALAEIQHRPTF